MERRTAVAAASAITMAMLSGAVAVGAHLGALGFTGHASVPPAAVAAPAATGATPSVVTTPAPVTKVRHDDDRFEHEAGGLGTSNPTKEAHDD